MSDRNQGRLLPAIISIVVAVMLTIAPMPPSLAPFRPDFVAMTLIYWTMMNPGSLNVGSAWLTGLLLDVAQGTLLGQHALGLALIVYLTVKFHLQFRQFPMLQMMATVFALLGLYQFVLFWINGVAGVNVPAIRYWGPLVSGTLLWPFLAFVLANFRRRSR